MILQRINTRGGGVLLKFPCNEPRPGQCVAFDGKYFVIAHHFNGVGAVFTKPKSAIDLPHGTHVDLSKPVGKGFNVEAIELTPVIVTGGTGFAAGLSLLRHFYESKQDFRMVAYTRQPSQVDDVTGLLAVPRDDRLQTWNTQLLGRPAAPLDPLNISITASTPVFFAGPKELHEALRTDLDKRGLSDVTIRLNY